MMGKTSLKNLVWRKCSKQSKKMEAVGRLPIYQSELPFLVIGGVWPAWLPVVPALGAKVSLVICKANSHWESEESTSEAPRMGVWTKEAVLFMEESPKDMLIFVSGSAKFVLSLEPTLRNKSHIVVAFDLGNRAGYRPGCKGLSRVLAGGKSGAQRSWRSYGNTELDWLNS
jgi:hypothetical protein